MDTYCHFVGTGYYFVGKRLLFPNMLVGNSIFVSKIIYHETEMPFKQDNEVYRQIGTLHVDLFCV